MTLTWEEFETQLRELPRKAETIDLFKRLSGPAVPVSTRPFTRSVTSACSWRFCRWIESLNGEEPRVPVTVRKAMGTFLNVVLGGNQHGQR